MDEEGISIGNVALRAHVRGERLAEIKYYLCGVIDTIAIVPWGVCIAIEIAQHEESPLHSEGTCVIKQSRSCIS